MGYALQLSTTTNQPKQEKVIVMTKGRRRVDAEDRLRAESTVPQQKWWKTLVFWLVVAVIVGGGYRLISPAPIEGRVEDRLAIVHHLGILVLNNVILYGLTYYGGRDMLARRGIAEIWRSEHNGEALNRFGLPMLLSVLGFLVLTASGSITSSLYQGLMLVSAVFVIYRSLTTAYIAHYFDYVMSPSEKRVFNNDEELKGKGQKALERAATMVGLKYPRQRMVFPLIQTLLVAFGVQYLFAAAWVLIAKDASGLDSMWVAITATTFPVISVFLWSIWHLRGGFVSVFRMGEGRSMKSFGWRNPDMLSD